MPYNSDLLEHYKLNADQLDGSVIHCAFISDRARGLRNVRIQERWENIKMVGQGSFGDVWLQKQAGSTTQRAVKVLRKMSLQFQRIEYKRELEALAKFDKSQIRQQEVIVQFFGWWEVEHSVYLAMEYFELGDLSPYITEGCISEQDAKDIALDLLQALVIMHSEGFTHRDLKPQNIFVARVSPKYWVKLGDFGIAKRVTNQSTALRTEVGTPYFSAPEIEPDDYQEKFEYTNAVDVWSLGCVVYNCLAQCPPFRSRRAKTLPFPMQPLKGRVHVDSVAFLECLLKVDPLARCTAQEALDHAWLQNISNSSNAADEHWARTNTSGYPTSTLNGYDLNELGERTVLSKSSSVKYQSSKLGTDEMNNQKAEVFKDMDLIDCFRGPMMDHRYMNKVSIGDMTKALQLIRKGANLKIKDTDGQTALHWAVKMCMSTTGGLNSEVVVEFVRELLERGAEVDARDHWHFTPLLLTAPIHYHLPFMGLGYSALKGMRLAVIRVLLEYEAEVNAQGLGGYTCLHRTALCSESSAHDACEVIDILLEHGADVNAKDFYGLTALHRVNNFKVAERLLLAGIDIDAVDSSGETALQHATSSGHRGVADAIRSFKQRPRKAQR